MVELASSLREADGTTPLSARYHLFLRATEGAFTCLSRTGPHVQLARHTRLPGLRCASLRDRLLQALRRRPRLGTPTPEEGVLHLRPRKAASRAPGSCSGTTTVSPTRTRTPQWTTATKSRPRTARLCTGAAPGRPTGMRSVCPGCAASDDATGPQTEAAWRRKSPAAWCAVPVGPPPSGSSRPARTPAAPSSPPRSTSTFRPAADPTAAELPGEGRKLLAFSDSRQSAAYFAPYLEDSYARLQRRRLIVARDCWPLTPTRSRSRSRTSSSRPARPPPRSSTFHRRLTAQQASRVVAPWVMAEVLATDDRQSLEGLGLVSYQHVSATRAGRRQPPAATWA